MSDDAVNHDTYFVMGTRNGAPVVYLEMDVPGLERSRIADRAELRHIVDTAAEELKMQATAHTVALMLNDLLTPKSQDEVVQERMQAAMAARQQEEEE